MRRREFWTGAALALAGWACGGGSGGSGDGGPDGGAVDGGADAARADDAGADAASAADVGATSDGGMVADAGAVDGASADGATPDAGGEIVPLSCVIRELTHGRLVYDVRGGNREAVDALVEFSRDGGDTFEAANAERGNNPRSVPADVGIEFPWDSEVDGYPPCGEAVLRVTVDDGVAPPANCTRAAFICPLITGCRAVDALGTEATGPTGVNPAYLPADVNGGPGVPPASGHIGDSNFQSEGLFWDFDYVGLNEGAFDTTVQLTDASGANVGNPLVLFSAGHDYAGFMDGSRCNGVAAFQVALEARLGDDLLDLASQDNDVGGSTVVTTWSVDDAGLVQASVNGQVRAVGENGCTRMRWSARVQPGPGGSTVALDPSCQDGEFAVCVDSGGVDTDTRRVWLPEGDYDANLPGSPSGPPSPRSGALFGVTFVVNSGERGVGALAARTEYDERRMDEAADQATRSIAGSTQPPLGSPFAVNASVPGQTRWNDVDAFANVQGIFDVATQIYRAGQPGEVELRFINEELADGDACNIWVRNPCMPFNSFVCPNPPPAGGYRSISATGRITIEAAE